MERRIVYYVDRGDRLGLIEALKSGNGDIGFTDVEGQSLLHAAAVKTVPISIADELIRLGIDVNRQDARGRTPLQYAIIWKRADVAALILKAGGRLDISDEHGNEPLWYAVNDSHCDSALIQMLMRNGANPHHQNKYGKSPLDAARQRGLTLADISFGQHMFVDPLE